MNAHEQAVLLTELGDKSVSYFSRGRRWLMWSCVATVAIFFLWAGFAKIDEVTRGEGRVIPMARMQTIKSLEGGILAELMVGRGDRVEVGQPLLRLDETRFKSAFLETQTQIDVLKAAIARLQAEVLERNKIEFEPSIAAQKDLVNAEQSLFKARRDRLHEAEKAIKAEMAMAQQQLNLVKPLIAKRSVSEMEGLRLGQTIASLNGRLTEIRNTYVQDAYTELSAKQAELGTLEQTLTQRNDQLQRTHIHSPVRGRVNDILLNTLGGVIQPGEPIMEITPVEDKLLVEAKVKPKDVAFVAPGMTASVKLTAYDYSIYGDVKGVVEQISEDTIEEDTGRGKEAFYVVLISTQTAHLEHKGEVLLIRPGMVAQVDIHTGKRTVLSYLLNPIIKARLR